MQGGCGAFAPLRSLTLHVLPNDIFVLAMSHYGQRTFGKKSRERAPIFDQHSACGGAHEELYSAYFGGRHAAYFAQIIGCGTDVERIVGEAPASGQCELIIEQGGRSGRGDGVGHIHNRGYPSGDSGRRFGSHIAFQREPRVAKMYVSIYDARHDDTPCGIQSFARKRVRIFTPAQSLY
jgi:hypothetical protein